MPQKILVVDDERHIVRLIQVSLERAGFEVVTAYDGKGALEKVASEKPDLITLDWLMPYLDGIDVVKKLKGDPATESIPIIMITGKGSDKDVFEGYHYGVDYYMTKPLNPNEVVTYTRRILETLKSRKA